MKKTFTTILAALMLAGMAAAASAWEQDVDYTILADSVDPSYAKSTETLPACTSGTLLTGSVYASVNSQGIHCKGNNSALNLFDGSTATYFERWDGSRASYGGLILDQAYELTEVRIAPCPDLETGALFNITVQGSNDGENWVTIVQMIQDAHGQDYHIFTPQTADYPDMSARMDESIHWKNNGAYKMFRITGATAAEVELYGNPGEPTETTPESVSAMNIATLNYFGGHINVRENAEIADVDGNLKGTVIGAGGAWNKAVYDNAFDNNAKKIYDAPLEGQNCWVGMLMAEPHALTEVRILPKRGAYENVADSYIQGSNDGVSWVNLAEFTAEDIPTKQEWISKPVTDTNGYTYFRYVNAVERQSSIADLLFYGAPASAGEAVTFEPLIATETKFTGELDFLDVTSTSYEGSVTGQVFGYGFGWRDRGRGYAGAWDGSLDPETGYGEIPRIQGWDHFTGIKTDAPVAAAQVRINIETLGDTHYFQGSNDGTNWTTLTTFGFDDSHAFDEWYVKDITDTAEYSYFRFVNNGNTENSAIEIAIYTADSIPAFEADPETAAPETEAAETAAPETEAPETEAPETEAPETAAPETEAAETAAPETEAAETAAPETEAPTDAEESDSKVGLYAGIAAVAVVVIAAVVAVIVKKRK